MFYLMQFFIIIAISFLGEILHHFIPLPIPASVYGLVLMLFFLKTKIIKLHQVKDTAKFLIEIMPVMFIPPTVGIMVAWPLISNMVVEFCVIAVVTTIVVMVVTGHMSQLIIRMKKRKERK